MYFSIQGNLLRNVRKFTVPSGSYLLYGDLRINGNILLKIVFNKKGQYVFPVALTVLNFKALYKGKTIPVHPWTNPEGSRRLRLPDFKTIGI